MEKYINRIKKISWILLILILYSSFVSCSNTIMNVLELHKIDGYSKRSYFVVDSNYVNIILHTYSKVGFDSEQKNYKLGVSIPDFSIINLYSKNFVNNNKNINCSFSFNNNTYFSFVGHIEFKEKTDSTLTINFDINPITTKMNGESILVRFFYKGEITLIKMNKN